MCKQAHRTGGQGIGGRLAHLPRRGAPIIDKISKWGPWASLPTSRLLSSLETNPIYTIVKTYYNKRSDL